MLFDRFAAMVERWLPEYRPPMDYATIIKIDIVPHEVLHKHHPSPALAEHLSGFRLPYPITVVEDQASCILLADTYSGQTGLADNRLFLECLPAGPLVSDRAFNMTLEERLALRECRAGDAEDAVIIQGGLFSVPGYNDDSQWLAHGTLHALVAGDLDHLGLSSHDIPQLPQEAADACVRNAVTAIEEIIHIRSLPNFTGWPDHTIERSLASNRRCQQRTIWQVQRDGLFIPA